MRMISSLAVAALLLAAPAFADDATTTGQTQSDNGTCASKSAKSQTGNCIINGQNVGNTSSQTGGAGGVPENNMSGSSGDNATGTNNGVTTGGMNPANSAACANKEAKSQTGGCMVNGQPVGNTSNQTGGAGGGTGNGNTTTDQQ
jgi:hypothetical protein